MCKCTVTAPGPTEEILLHTELGVNFHHCWWGWFQFKDITRVMQQPVHLPARGASLLKQFHTPWKLSGQLRSNTPRQSETWNEIKGKKHSIVTALCICAGHVAFNNLGGDLQGMATSHPWAVWGALMKIKGSQPGQAGSGNQEIMARS